MATKRPARVLWAVVCLCAAASARAQTPDNPIAALDRVAVALTGLPASPADVEAHLKSGASLAEIAERLRRTPAFEQRLTEYWLQVLGITAPIGFLDIVDRGVGRSVATSLLNKRRPAQDGGGGGIALSNCTNLLVPNDPNRRQKPIDGVNELYRIPVATTDPEFDQLSNCVCNDTSGQPIPDKVRAEKVTPYWNTASQVLVCPKVTYYCGSDLSKCFPTDALASASHFAPLHAPISAGLTLEPGMMIARIVAEDRPWDEVLRGTRRLVNGPLAAFIREFGTPYLNAAPPGSYGDVGAGPIATLDRADPTFHWVEGSNLNAGVLSTTGFQRVTNGWRAKANRAMKAFLCRELTVPDGVKQVPSAESELTRKPYCQSCHVTLEPLSQLFGRWPTLGDTNYFYNEATGVSAIGSFRGVVDADTAGLARIFTDSGDFDECAVRRAFDFVVGRPMSAAEERLMLEPLVHLFLDSDKRVWPVMRRIIESPAFNGGGEP